MYSSQLTQRTDLNCGILTAAIILSHSTDNCYTKVFFNYEIHAASSHRELTRRRASVSPTNPWSNTRKALLPTVLQLLRYCWRGQVTPPHSCVIQVFIAVAWQQTRRGDARLGTTPHGTAGFGSASSTVALSWERVSTLQFLHGVSTPHYVCTACAIVLYGINWLMQ
jgi:hypothetical protein